MNKKEYYQKSIGRLADKWIKSDGVKRQHYSEAIEVAKHLMDCPLSHSKRNWAEKCRVYNPSEENNS